MFSVVALIQRYVVSFPSKCQLVLAGSIKTIQLSAERLAHDKSTRRFEAPASPRFTRTSNEQLKACFRSKTFDRRRHRLRICADKTSNISIKSPISDRLVRLTCNTQFGCRTCGLIVTVVTCSPMSWDSSQANAITSPLMSRQDPVVLCLLTVCFYDTIVTCYDLICSFSSPDSLLSPKTEPLVSSCLKYFDSFFNVFEWGIFTWV